MIEILKDLIPLAIAIVCLTVLWLVMGWPLTRKPKPRRCKDCKNDMACLRMAAFYSENNMDIDKAVMMKCIATDMKYYKRKRFQFWAAK